MDFKEEKIVLGDGHVAIHDWVPENPEGNHKNSAEIERDIDETRHTMDLLFDTLTNKLSPRTMADHFLDRFQVPENRKKTQDFFLNTARRINQSFQENPVSLLLIGAGIGLLFLERQKVQEKVSNEAPGEKIKGITGGFSQKADKTVSAIKGTVSNNIEKVKESLRTGSEKVKESFQSSKEKAVEAIEKAKQAGHERLSPGYSWKEKATQGYSETGNSVLKRIKDKPLAVGVAAAMFGLTLGVLFTETQTERQTIGDSTRETFKKAQEKEKGIVEQGKSVVDESVKNVFDEVKEKSISLEHEIKRPEEKSVVKEQHPVTQKKGSGESSRK